ncbi:UPF0175 family protein [Salinibacter ruber]|uniref:UPF0175 family protein n=1 Tax=Salinibacter ruber TaxID=146919 RepID=UPI0021CEBA75
MSFGKARELAGMSVWDFQQLLGHRGIAVHYDVEAYEQDRQTPSLTPPSTGAERRKVGHIVPREQ